LRRVISQCLAKQPNQRLQSARDLALALRASATDIRVGRLGAGGLRSWHRIGIGLAILLALIAAISLFVLNRGTGPTGLSRDSSGSTPIDAIAVLPFVHDAGDPKTEMLAGTLAEHIIDSLRQVGRSELKIRPPSSVFRYAQQRPDTLTIGRELNVPLIVTGTIRQLGDELRITVEVVDARNDNLLWRSEPLSVRRGETLDSAAQDKMVRGVAANLGIELNSDEQQRLTRRQSANQEAYDLYREAMFHYNKFSREGLDASLEAGKKAIESEIELKAIDFRQQNGFSSTEPVHLKSLLLKKNVLSIKFYCKLKNFLISLFLLSFLVLIFQIFSLH
jgi:TolB-like protein